jgi:tetratricopeptide (TPR) repeat protein
MDKPNNLNLALVGIMQWLVSRVGVIYCLVIIFSLTCVDLKNLQERIKIRYLNDAIPDFSNMIIFSKTLNAKNDFYWSSYKDYFRLVLRYMPDDLVTDQLLGYVDYYTGQEQKAIELFKASNQIKGHPLFWSNYNLGVVYYKQGNWPQAADYLFQAISSSPQLTLALIQQSMVYRQITASPYFIKYNLGQELNGATSDAYVLLLSSLYHMGQYEKMMIVVKIAMANQTLLHKDALYYYAGLALLGQTQVPKAVEFFQQSLSLEKANPDVYYYLGDIYQHAGQLTQAQYFMQISYALHQKNDPRFPYDRSITLRFF